MQTPRPESPRPSYGARVFGRQRNPSLGRRGGETAKSSAGIIQGLEKRWLGSSASPIWSPPRPAAPFKDSCKQGVALAATRPAPWGSPQRRLAGGGEGAGRCVGGCPTWGPGGGRLGSVSARKGKKKKKKKQKFFSRFPGSRAAFRGARGISSARGGPGFRGGGGAWNPLPFPGESRARGFPRLCWGLARGGGPACSRIPPRRWEWCFSPV